MNQLRNGSVNNIYKKETNSSIIKYIFFYFFASIVLVFYIFSIKNISLTMGFSCFITSIVSFYLIFNAHQKDPFESIKFTAGLYGISFGIAPLLLFEHNVYQFKYVGQNWKALLDYASLLSMFGLFCIVLGYKLTGIVINRKKSKNIELSKTGKKTLFRFGLLFFSVGIICYIILVMRSGGVSHFLTFKGARGDIFQQTFGGFFWGSFFLISGQCAIALALIDKHPYWVALISLFVGILFALFQGREQFIAPIFCGLVIYHYGYKRLSLTKISILAISLFILSSIYGVYRASDRKEFIMNNPSEFLTAYINESDNFLKTTLAQNIEQLDVLMISLRYIDTTANPLHGRSLLNWLSPVNRFFFNDYFDLIHTGSFMFKISNPERRFARTALSPSLPGELFLNFEETGLFVGLFLYGIVLRLIYSPIERSKKNLAFIAIYPYALWNIGKMVIDGVGLLFKLVTVSMPLLLLIYFIRLNKEL